jgi:hypothetical protein
MHLWLAVRTQWRAAGFGIVGLDYGEVRRSARDMDIRMTPGLWAKIKRLEYFELERQGKSADGANQGSPAEHPHAQGGPPA